MRTALIICVGLGLLTMPGARADQGFLSAVGNRHWQTPCYGRIGRQSVVLQSLLFHLGRHEAPSVNWSLTA